jgi:hypothetical protein
MLQMRPRFSPRPAIAPLLLRPSRKDRYKLEVSELVHWAHVNWHRSPPSSAIRADRSKLDCTAKNEPCCFVGCLACTQGYAE